MLTSNPENVKAHGVVDTPGISDHCLIFIYHGKFYLKVRLGQQIRHSLPNVILCNSFVYRIAFCIINKIIPEMAVAR